MRRSALFAANASDLVCNQASVMPDTFAHAADVFGARDEFTLTTLFGPQHGIRGDVQYNMIETPHAVDERTGMMVYSLYSRVRECRPRRWSATSTHSSSTCRTSAAASTRLSTRWRIACVRRQRFGKKVVVCDRPNPIGGVAVEGNITEHEFKSFVGQFELPTRHGMTIGELARMFNEHFGIGCELEVVEMTGWSREMFGDETGLPWILPSAQYADVDTCVVFPATVHIEGTELCEGRGTTLPFVLNGAPFIDPYQWAPNSTNSSFEGVAFRQAYFRPTFRKWADRTCGGVQIHVTDREAFTPVIVGIAMVKTAYDHVPRKIPVATRRLRIRLRQKPIRRRLRHR